MGSKEWWEVKEAVKARHFQCEQTAVGAIYSVTPK
jgi:hypothetical protein